MASIIDSNNNNSNQKSTERLKRGGKHSPHKMNINLAKSAIGLPKLPKIGSRNDLSDIYYHPNNKFVLDFTGLDSKRCSS